MYFGHKYVETGPNSSHELATFLKYHIPLIKFFIHLNYLTKNKYKLTELTFKLYYQER